MTSATGWAARVVGILVGAAALLVVAPGAASAHPLGNFTVNRYSGVVVSTDQVTVDHVLDIAEIPTAQRRPEIDTSGDGTLSRAELASWAQRACRDEAAGLHLTVARDRLPLTVTTARARTLPGQAGLPVLRVECRLHADSRVTGPTRVRLVDTAGRGEVGWRELTAQGDGTTLTRSDVPRRSGSGRLVRYPDDLLSDPLDVMSARLSVRPGGPALDGDLAGGADLPSGPLARGADRQTGAFEGLLERSDDGPLLGLVALLGAVVLGAAHAVAPGHGKTIMAFYLSGQREGALRSAATVGATVTATHTAGVLALGLVASAGTALAPARVYPWLGVASGLLVVAVGIALLRAATPGAPGQHTHGQHPYGQHPHGTAPGQHPHGTVAGQHTHGTALPPRGDHAVVVPRSVASPGPATTHPPTVADHAVVGTLVRDHPHEDHHPHEHHAHEHRVHDHGHGRPHDQVAGPSRRGLVAMGLAGGLLPSPSALVVFLGALALGRPWFGIALVAAFGLGMASTLAVVGLLVMRLRERAERHLARRHHAWFRPLLRAVPLLTAAVVVVLGAALALRGLGATGIV